jgi:ABC-2 type transport system permease protein
MSIESPQAPMRSSSTEQSLPAQAVVADRRFQHYEGKRQGAAYAFFSLWLHSIGWVLGHKRSSRYKIVPSLFLLTAFAPAVIIVIVEAVAPGTLVPYTLLYFFALPATYIFAAITAPELICPDRRHGTIRMYVTSNLNAPLYVAAKVAAAWSVLAIVTTLPELIVFGGYTFLGVGPHGVTNWFTTFGAVLGAGMEMATFYGTIALAISSLTDRNSFASAGIVLTFVLSGAALGILQGPLQAPDWVSLVNVNGLPTDFMLRIYNVAAPDRSGASLPTWQVGAAVAAWVLGGVALLAYRYRGEGRK